MIIYIRIEEWVLSGWNLIHGVLFELWLISELKRIINLMGIRPKKKRNVYYTESDDIKSFPIKNLLKATLRFKSSIN